MDLNDRWTKHLRATSRQTPDYPEQTDVEAPVESSPDDLGKHGQESSRREQQKQKKRDAAKITDPSALLSEKRGRRADPTTKPPAAAGRNETTSPTARDGQKDDDKDFDRGPQAKGSLWTGDRSAAPPATQKPSSSSQTTRSLLLPEPVTRPISHEQLITEVKAIYAGLVMVESKCIEVDNAQTNQTGQPQKLNNEQWQALITLHKTLLHEHHDFFLASQHPAASPALKRLPSKYAMPARMWRHGIHSFLELLRHRLPGSLEHMLTFIYLAYSMITLLYETVPAFKDTWIECLGDLGRYRMAIEDENMKDREIWTGVSRDWYTMASDHSPTVGRLYHHLAILARPNGIQQLFYYAKSVCVPTPFASARESAMTLFGPHLSGNGPHIRVTVCEGAFIRCHGVIFSNSQVEQFEKALGDFTGSFDDQVNKAGTRASEQGYQMGVANTCALIGYGGEESSISCALRAKTRAEADAAAQVEEGEMATATKERAIALNRATNAMVLRKTGDSNILAYLHVVMAFFYHISASPILLKRVEEAMEWRPLARMLNVLAAAEKRSRHEEASFPVQEKGDAYPFPEDWALRGLVWGEFFPENWFSGDRSKVDDGERLIERPSLEGERRERILWLATRMAETGNSWLVYNKEKRMFGVREGYGRKNEIDWECSDDESEKP